MRRRRIAARTLLALWIAAGAHAATEELRVGSASEIDTEGLRRAIVDTRGGLGSEPRRVRARTLGLEEAIRIALEQNLPLQIAELDRDISEREVPARRAFFHPTPGYNFLASDTLIQNSLEVVDPVSGAVLGLADQNASARRNQAFVRQQLPTGALATLSFDMGREKSTDPDVGKVYTGGAQITLRQPLMRGGRIYVATAPIQDAEYGVGVFESQLRAQILLVTANTKQAYYNTVLGQRLIEVSEQAIERDHQLILASETLFRAGRASQRDIVSAQLQLSKDLSELAKRREARDLADLSLRDVLGLPIGDDVGPAETTIPFDPVPMRLPEWIDSALARRPEIRQILYRLEQSALALRVSQNNVLPKIDFVGTYRRDDEANGAAKALGFNNHFWVAGVEFEIPFGNVAARERMREFALQHARVERELESQKRIIELEVRTETVSLRKNLDEVEVQTNKVEQARTKLEIARVRYQRGIADNFDVTDAQTDLVEAESDLLAAIVDYNNGLARLEASIAGPL
jgi:outer membrane protein